LKELYIIGHNANSINEAIEHLSDGANGLQADICFIPNTFEKFYLHEKQPVSEFEVTELYGMIKDGEVTSLKNFLHEVSGLLGTNPRFRLSMIFLNLIQPYDIDINELFGVIRQNLKGDLASTMVLAAASGQSAAPLFAALVQQGSNEAVSINDDITPRSADKFFSRLHFNYGYGTGTAMPALSSAADSFTDRARIAVSMKSSGEAAGMKVIYAMVVNSESSMKTYLDIGVDAIITDRPGRLRNLVESKLYNRKFSLAGRCKPADRDP